jgi:hypothetical protein
LKETTEFKTVREFEKFCYFECPIGKDPIQKIGCIHQCKLRQLRKVHPEWFGRKNVMLKRGE